MKPALLGWVPSGWGKYLLNVQESRSLGGLLVPIWMLCSSLKTHFCFLPASRSAKGPPGQVVVREAGILYFLCFSTTSLSITPTLFLMLFCFSGARGVARVECERLTFNWAAEQ